jgi:DNA modification methylase
VDRRSTFSLANSDAVAWLRTLPTASVDLIVTDPPYESLEKHRAVGTTTRLKQSKASSNEWFAIFPNARFPELFAEAFRVLKRDAHFYLYCDPETMFVAKPLAEQAGFKFWKPLIWDKCLGPDTPVWTERGVVRIEDIVPGDRVAIPEGGSSPVVAARRTRAPSVKLALSDGTQIVASWDHRFMRRDGRLVEAAVLREGDALATRPVRQRISDTLRLDEVIPEDDAIHELPEVKRCLWCGEGFDSSRAAAAHQARWCEAPVSKRQLAERLGISPKRLRRWMSQGRIHRAWARALGIEDKLGARVQCYLQNDLDVWYPRAVPLDHDFGRVIGLYAAEGCKMSSGVSFALHADEKHLQNTIARFARRLGMRAVLHVDGQKAVVEVGWKMMRYLVAHFVGGDNARTKFFKPSVYGAPDAFRRGVLDGLLEGDGHWSHDEQRETYVSASPDLAMFVRRELEARDRAPTVQRFENDHAGGWKVRHDPVKAGEPLTVTAIEDIGEQDLIDISIADRDELFLLGNGAVTHNCTIGMGYHYRARYECILFFEKGKRKLADLGTADIIEQKRIIGGYPAEKPPEVTEVLVTQSSLPGELVIDPFMGSGSTGVAAARHGRDFLGNDLCAEAVEITRARLAELADPANGLRPVESSASQLGLGL